MNAWISDGGDVLRMTDGDRKGAFLTYQHPEERRHSYGSGK